MLRPSFHSVVAICLGVWAYGRPGDLAEQFARLALQRARGESSDGIAVAARAGSDHQVALAFVLLASGGLM